MGCLQSSHEDANFMEQRCPLLNSLFGVAAIAFSIFDFSTDLINGTDFIEGYMPCNRVQFQCEESFLSGMGAILIIAGSIGFLCELTLHWIWYRRNKHNINCCCFGTGGSKSSENRDVQMMSRDMEAAGDDGSTDEPLGQKNIMVCCCFPGGCCIWVLMIVKLCFEDFLALVATMIVLTKTNAIPATKWLMLGLISSLVGLWFTIIKLIRMQPWVICRCVTCLVCTVLWSGVFIAVAIMVLWPTNAYLRRHDAIVLSIDQHCNSIGIDAVWDTYSGNVTRALVNSDGDLINFTLSESFDGYSADSIVSSVDCTPYLNNATCLGGSDVRECGFDYIRFRCTVTTKECGTHNIDVQSSVCQDFYVECSSGDASGVFMFMGGFHACFDYCN